MAEASINDIKRGYYSAALGYTLGQAMEKSLSDLEYEFFSQAPTLPAAGSNGQYLRSNGTSWVSQAGPPTITQAQAENPADVIAGLATGQRIGQGTAGYLKSLPGYAAGKTLKVNAAGTGFEWVS